MSRLPLYVRTASRWLRLAAELVESLDPENQSGESEKQHVEVRITPEAEAMKVTDWTEPMFSPPVLADQDEFLEGSRAWRVSQAKRGRVGT